jgi:uncharacterized protein YecT (DUF1311 family)
MKLRSFLAASCLLSTLTSPSQAMPTAISHCMDKAKTQLDTNQCASLYQKGTDAELNAVYQQVIKANAGQPKFLAKLRIAQRAWIAWRDAELNALYPDKDDPSAYGSALAACWSLKTAVLTEARIKQLRQWITGAKEGDVCSGSIPVK